MDVPPPSVAASSVVGPSVAGSGVERPAWRRALRAAYLVLVLAAFVYAVVSRRQELADQIRSLDPLPIAVSTLFGLAGVGVSGMIWRRMMIGLDGRMPLWASAKVFFVAQLGKYLPGSLWPVVAQAEMGRDHGIPRRTAVAGQTLFMWIHLVSGGIIGLPVIAAVGLVPRWVALVPLLLVGLLLPGPLVRSMNWLLGRFGRQPLPGRPSGVDVLIACGWAVIMWVCYGLHIHYAIDSLEFVAPGPLPMLVAIGAFAAAWSAGFLFLIAPAGAGARELVLIAGLSTVSAPETALAVTLLSRLVLSLADGLWGGAGLLAGVGRAATAGPPVESSPLDSGVDPGVDGSPGQR